MIKERRGWSESGREEEKEEEEEEEEEKGGEGERGFAARMASFLKEIAALMRNNNAVEVGKRLTITSNDSSKKTFVDSLASKPYQVLPPPLLLLLLLLLLLSLIHILALLLSASSSPDPLSSPDLVPPPLPSPPLPLAPSSSHTRTPRHQNQTTPPP